MHINDRRTDMSIAQTITPLPTAPSRSDPVNFDDRADLFLSAMEDVPVEINVFSAEANALAVEINGDKTDSEQAVVDSATQVSLAVDQVALAANEVAQAEAASEAALSTANVTIYSGATTYNYPDSAIGSDSNTYRCTTTSVLGDDPVGSATGNWLNLTTGDLFSNVNRVAVHFLVNS